MVPKMTPEQFAYWLQGFVEVGGGHTPTAQQWMMIKEHLRLVFNKVTPEIKVESAIAGFPVQPSSPPFDVPKQLKEDELRDAIAKLRINPKIQWPAKDVIIC